MYVSTIERSQCETRGIFSFFYRRDCRAHPVHVVAADEQVRRVDGRVRHGQHADFAREKSTTDLSRFVAGVPDFKSLSGHQHRGKYLSSSNVT